MQEIENEKERLGVLYETSEHLKKAVERLHRTSQKIFEIRGGKQMRRDKELINFAFYRGGDYYPLAEGTYKAENLSVEVGSTFWFYHPDDDEMQAYYVDTVETAIGEGQTYVCAFSNCCDDFIYYVMSNIHRIAI